MLGDKIWLTAGAWVLPKRVGWGGFRAPCGPVKFILTALGKASLYGAGFVHGSIFI